MGIIIIVIVLVGAYVAGRIIGARGNPTTATPGTNSPDLAACKEACDQWDQRRAERCNAEKDEATAKAAVDTARANYWAAVGSATAAAGAAWATTQVCNAIPFPPLKAACYVVAAGLIAAAAALWAYAAYLLGILGSKEVDYANKSGAASAARAAEAQARAIMMAKCPSEEVTNCLNRPAPC